MLKKIIISSLLVNILLLLGRFTGFIREVYIANIFGVTSESDIVALLVTIPDFLVSILAGGALSAALIPSFTRLNKKDSDRLTIQVCLLLFFVFTAIALLFFIFSENFIALLAPGFSDEKIKHTVSFINWIFITLPISVLSGVFVARLHTNNKFLIASVSTPVFNLVLLIGLFYLWLTNSTSLFVIVLFLLLAACARLLLQFSFVNISSFRLDFKNWMISTDLMKRYGQAFLSGSLFLFFPIIARAYSSLEGDGSIAIFTYSMKLIELPLIISVSFISIVLFPRLAASYNVDSVLHGNLIKYGIQSILAISIVITFLLVFLVHDYVLLVYGSGIDESSVLVISQVTKVGLLSIPFQCLNVFFTSISNSRGETKKPMYINLIGLITISITLEFFIENITTVNVMWVVSSAYTLCFLLYLCSFSVKEFKFKMLFNNKLFIIFLFFLPFIFIALAPIVFKETWSFWLVFLFGTTSASIWLGVLLISHSDIRGFALRKLKNV